MLTNVQGKAQTELHDEVLVAIRGALEWAGAEVELEVRGVFAAAAQQSRMDVEGREWQWARPDMRVRFPGKGWQYYELKTCMFSTSLPFFSVPYYFCTSVLWYYEPSGHFDIQYIKPLC